MKIDSILREVLERINPGKKELSLIENSLKKFIQKLGKKIMALNIDAKVFVGGSFAKKNYNKKRYL